MTDVQKYRIHYRVRDATTRKLINEDHHDGTHPSMKPCMDEWNRIAEVPRERT